jgi:hypothetical protein
MDDVDLELHALVVARNLGELDTEELVEVIGGLHGILEARTSGSTRRLLELEELALVELVERVAPGALG